jgi:hypothetical protein
MDPAIEAAIIGAVATVVSVGVAFFGVLLTIRANRVRAREDQLLALRRGAYLEACDVTAEAVQFLTTLPDPNVTLAQGAILMRKVTGMFGKLHILADQETLKVANDYMKGYLDEYAKAAKIKGAYEMNAIEITNADERMASLSGDPTLLSNPLAAETRNRLRQQILKLERENLELTRQLVTYCPSIVDRLAPLAMVVTLALREELNLKLDKRWYEKLQAENLRAGEVRSKPLIDAMEENLAKIHASRPG